MTGFEGGPEPGGEGVESGSGPDVGDNDRGGAQPGSNWEPPPFRPAPAWSEFKTIGEVRPDPEPSALTKLASFIGLMVGSAAVGGGAGYFVWFRFFMQAHRRTFGAPAVGGPGTPTVVVFILGGAAWAVGLSLFSWFSKAPKKK